MHSLISCEEPVTMATLNLDSMRLAQRQWASVPVARRVKIVRSLRHLIAADATTVAETVPLSLPGSLHRTVADTLVSEVLPLLETCRFLEREAESILRTRHVGDDGRPVLLGRVTAEVQRAPWGIVLILAPANYPLLLAGVQTLQALVAGNAVLWKPAPDTETCAFALKTLFAESGLDAELLTILPSDIASAEAAFASGVDHVILTGSAQTGRAVLHQLAETLTPSTMELSGCDAAFILPGADLDHAVRALAFGLRFNGSATCMAPRRIFLVDLSQPEAARFESSLAAALAEIGPVALPPAIEKQLRAMLDDAGEQTAEIMLDGLAEANSKASSNPEVGCRATLITRATPALRSMQEEIFAPILSVMRAASSEEALAAYAACPYALTASVFGSEREARRFAHQIRAGNIVINDLIVPTADPRIPFGGRGQSGFGVTRGTEGLFAMTTPCAIQSQKKVMPKVYESTSSRHVPLFAGLALVIHGSGFKQKWKGFFTVVRNALQVTTRPK
ncbi:aldehyde dehydrogenase family protein [Acidicapsa dinghuensis]|uniref:Aldehyde dehydrogenase family protein n=1 Tax=Acidicapsa dinghuensis TaxID=2218256 RepID=A0ABW1EAA4_9BACT|nr:aldehyde dehydrogenase family protein [Acidicapsa dinghuensis]